MKSFCRPNRMKLRRIIQFDRESVKTKFEFNKFSKTQKAVENNINFTVNKVIPVILIIPRKRNFTTITL